MGWPQSGKVTIKNLASNSATYSGKIGRIQLVGSAEPLSFTRDETGASISLPEKAQTEYVNVLKITSDV